MNAYIYSARFPNGQFSCYGRAINTTHQLNRAQRFRKGGRESFRITMWPNRQPAILETGEERRTTGNQRENRVAENHKNGQKRTRDICGPNTNRFEPVRSDSCPGPEQTFKGTPEIPPSRINLSPRLPDVVTRELERFLRLYVAVSEERSFRTGNA